MTSKILKEFFCEFRWAIKLPFLAPLLWAFFFLVTEMGPEVFVSRGQRSLSAVPRPRLHEQRAVLLWHDAGISDLRLQLLKNMAGAQINVPKLPFGKWSQRLKAAQPQLFIFEPHPYEFSSP